MTERRFVRLDGDGFVRRITIARPERLNALNRDVLTELRDTLAEATELVEEAGVRCLILTGEGKAFVAGADIDAMKAMSPEAARAFARLGHTIFETMEALPAPIIAAVNGFALGGGCELALACDFIIASTRAKLGQPEVKLGVIPGFGGTQRLLRRVGAARARELIFTGRMIGADEALAMGLVNAIHPPESLLDEVEKLAHLIAAVGPAAVTEAKRVIRDGEDKDLVAANALEIDAFARCFATADQKEGMEAFIAKREPRFEGR